MPREGPVRTTRTGHQPQHQAQRCPSCGTEVAAGKRFCDDCGAPLTATAPPPKPTAPRTPPSPQGVEFAPDSPLEEERFEPVWGFSCQAVVFGFAESSLFGAGKPFFVP